MKVLRTTSARARGAAGKALRTRVSRESHAEFSPAAYARDPPALLDASAQSRLRYLVPLRDERMADTAFTYFRGAAVVMAADLAHTPSTGLRVQACGDAHCLNFGGFASPERNLLFDVNDFDETLPGPWEWDLKRLVTSIVIAGRDNGLRKRDIRAAALATTNAYRTRISRLAALPAIDVWYARLDATDILAEARTFAQRKQRSKIAEQVATDSIRDSVEKLTTGLGTARRFNDDPPRLFHSSETDRSGFDVEQILAAYVLTLTPEMQFLLGRYTMIDHAVKVVGVGSVGTRCAIVLLIADDHDPLLLQVKEALPSVLEGYLEPSDYANHGERVVRGQRLMQTASDAFLGWARSETHDFYVRQFKDMKSSANLDNVDGDQLCVYGRYCAFALAAGHARSGDAAGIAGYIGGSDTLDRALNEFADAYADQNAHDHAVFSARVEDRIGGGHAVSVR
jgi:uncharacterized protein (DUF2252 family)